MVLLSFGWIFITFRDGFDKATVVLEIIGKEYRSPRFSAVPVIGQIKENITDYLTGKKDGTEQLSLLFSRRINDSIMSVSALAFEINVF